MLGRVDNLKGYHGTVRYPTAASSPLKDPVRDRLRHYGIEEAIGGDRFFPTIGVAVAAYLHEFDVDWLDWEDRPG